MSETNKPPSRSQAAFLLNERWTSPILKRYAKAYLALTDGTNVDAVLTAADWQQVVLNGGPPCFHFQDDTGTFCLRAKPWEGHGNKHFHRFISLHDLLLSFAVKVAL